MVWWSMVLLMIVSVTACTRADEPGSAPPKTPEAIASAAPPAAPDAIASATPASVAEVEEDGRGRRFRSAVVRLRDRRRREQLHRLRPETGRLRRQGDERYAAVQVRLELGRRVAPESGESLVHTFTKLGRVDVFVVGTDGEGRTSKVQLVLFLLSPEDYAQRQNIDPATLPTLVLPSPTPKP